jgi:hypothetical protein
MTEANELQNLILYGFYPLCALMITITCFLVVSKLSKIKDEINEVKGELKNIDNKFSVFQVDIVERLAVVETKVHEKDSRC